MASNFRSCPTFSIAASSSTRLQRADARPPTGSCGPLCERPGGASGHVPRACARSSRTRGRRCRRARRAGASASTRSAKRPAARSSATSARELVGRRRRARSPSSTVSAVGANSMTSERKPSSAEQLVAALARRPGVAERVDVERDRHVGVDAQQLAALPRLVGVGERAPRGTSSAARRPRARAARRACRTSTIRSRAPFSPMPGTPLTLSIASPISASTSTT